MGILEAWNSITLSFAALTPGSKRPREEPAKRAPEDGAPAATRPRLDSGPAGNNVPPVAPTTTINDDTRHQWTAAQQLHSDLAKPPAAAPPVLLNVGDFMRHTKPGCQAADPAAAASANAAQQPGLDGPDAAAALQLHPAPLHGLHNAPAALPNVLVGGNPFGQGSLSGTASAAGGSGANRTAVPPYAPAAPGVAQHQQAWHPAPVSGRVIGRHSRGTPGPSPGPVVNLRMRYGTPMAASAMHTATAARSRQLLPPAAAAAIAGPSQGHGFVGSSQV